MDEEPIQRVRTIIAEHEKSYRDSAWRWKFAYRFLLIASAIFSTSAAICGKLGMIPETFRADTATIFSACAAVITTIIAALDFEVNWRINRRSRHAVKVLFLESEKSAPKSDDLISQLQEIIRQRNEDLNKQD